MAGWDEVVDDLGLDGLVRDGLRHTALTWMADRTGVFALVGPIWAQLPRIRACRDELNAALIRPDSSSLCCRAGERPIAKLSELKGS
jgi:hypothetical protein